MKIGIKEKIYIAGKITGLEYKDAANYFKKAEECLKKMGYTDIINPINLAEEGVEWHSAMDICLKELKNCNAVYMLSNWEDSKGARIERSNAIGLGLEIIYEKIEKE